MTSIPAAARSSFFGVALHRRLAVALTSACGHLAAQPVQLDPTFAPVVTHEYSAVADTRIAPTSDGQFLAIGAFTHVNGAAVPLSGLVCLLADGALDPGFSAPVTAGETFQQAVALADGRLLAVSASNRNGVPPAVPSTTTSRVVRLLPTGQLDATFTSSAVDGDISLLELPDNRIIVWGTFTTVAGLPRNSLARLLADGSVDPSFAPVLSASTLYIRSLATDSAGRVILSAVDYPSEGGSHYFFLRLTSDGAIDPTFAPAAEGRTFSLLVALSDNSLLTGNGDLAHFKADGSRDPAYAVQIPGNRGVYRVGVLPGDRLAVEAQTGADPSVIMPSVFILQPDGTVERDLRDLPGAQRFQRLRAVLPDGRIAIVQGPPTQVVAPWFEWTPYYQPDMALPQFGLVNAPGTTVTPLPATLTTRGPGSVSRLTLDSAGRVLAEGDFTHIDDQPRAGYARFNLDGTLDPSFLPAPATSRHLFWYPDGRVIALETTLGPVAADGFRRDQSRVVRLLTDGTLDATFTPPNGLDVSAANWLAAAPDGHVLISAFEPDNQHEENLKLVWLAEDGHRLATLPTVFADFTLQVGIANETSGGTTSDTGWPQANAVQSAVLLPNGQLLIGAAVNTVNGAHHPAIVRLNSNGSVDPSYVPDLSSLTLLTAARPLPDGRALVYGSTRTNDTWDFDVTLRLNTDGSFDTALSLPLGRGQPLADGSLFWGDRRYRADGTLDLNFHPQFDLWPSSAVVTADTRLWVGGPFRTVDGEPHAALVRFTPFEPAGFTAQPQSQTIVAGRDVTFQAALGTSAPATYQWTFNGEPVAGAADPTLILQAIRPSQAGDYRLVATTNGKTYTSDVATLTVTPNTSRLVNFSARSQVSADRPPQIAGFVLRRGSPHPVLLRAVGRGLSFLLRDTVLLPEPLLRLYEGPTAIAENMGGILAPGIAEVAHRVGAFPVQADPVHDEPDAICGSALSLLLPAGAYTAHTSAADGRPGLSLFEFYDAASGDAAPAVANLSIRARSAPGADALFAGFVISGNGPLRLLLRGLGPRLTSLGVANPLADPQLTLYAGTTVLAKNDNWFTLPDAPALAATAQQVGAFALDPGSLDSALLVTLEPGVYSMQVEGVGQTAGEAMIELYVVEN